MLHLQKQACDNMPAQSPSKVMANRSKWQYVKHLIWQKDASDNQSQPSYLASSSNQTREQCALACDNMAALKFADVFAGLKAE